MTQSSSSGKTVIIITLAQTLALAACGGGSDVMQADSATSKIDSAPLAQASEVDEFVDSAYFSATRNTDAAALAAQSEDASADQTPLAASGEPDSAAQPDMKLLAVTSTAVTKAYVERMELVANDGLSEVSPIPNHWGLHQPRVTTHGDGTVRALYLRKGATGMINWRLMKRNAVTNVWSEEAVGESSDDVTLSRNPLTDAVHVVAWPSSVPTVYTSPKFMPKVIAGNWQKLPPSGRHYGNSGIASDGTLCLKASAEDASYIPTTATRTQITCGTYSATSGNWTWSAQTNVAIGSRRAYDYLFPRAFGVAGRLIGTGQLDLHKAALSLNSLRATEGNYVFDGVSMFSAQTTGSSSLKLMDVLPSLNAKSTTLTAPILRQTDGFIDSKGRLFISHFVSDPSGVTASGLSLAVTDLTGATLSRGLIPGLPRYGYTRVFEDAKSRLWMLWTNLGVQQTQATLYRLQETNGKFTPTGATDLSAKFAPYAIQGSPYLAVPRGGSAIGNAIDGLMVATDGTFVKNKMTSYYPAGVNRQKLVQFRIRLPD